MTTSIWICLLILTLVGGVWIGSGFMALYYRYDPRFSDDLQESLNDLLEGLRQMRAGVPPGEFTREEFNDLQESIWQMRAGETVQMHRTLSGEWVGVRPPESWITDEEPPEEFTEEDFDRHTEEEK